MGSEKTKKGGHPYTVTEKIRIRIKSYLYSLYLIVIQTIKKYLRNIKEKRKILKCEKYLKVWNIIAFNLMSQSTLSTGTCPTSSGERRGRSWDGVLGDVGCWSSSSKGIVVLLRSERAE